MNVSFCDNQASLFVFGIYGDIISPHGVVLYIQKVKLGIICTELGRRQKCDMNGLIFVVRELCQSRIQQNCRIWLSVRHPFV